MNIDDLLTELEAALNSSHSPSQVELQIAAIVARCRAEIAAFHAAGPPPPPAPRIRYGG